jgi:WhiB family redox-sensing transcriptional regulator
MLAGLGIPPLALGHVIGDNDIVVTTAVRVGATGSGASGPTPSHPVAIEQGGQPTMHDHDPEDRGWQDDANCLGVDPDLFFPERGASTREAKEVCRGCVVREECLEYALANGEKFGIWGGLSERERRRIRRQRAQAARRSATA